MHTHTCTLLCAIPVCTLLCAILTPTATVQMSADGSMRAKPTSAAGSSRRSGALGPCVPFFFFGGISGRCRARAWGFERERERERESEGRDGGREGERAVLGNNILDY